VPTLPLGKSSRRHVVDVVVLFTFLRQTMKRFDGMAESVSSCPVALLSWTFDGASVRLTRFSVVPREEKKLGCGFPCPRRSGSITPVDVRRAMMKLILCQGSTISLHVSDVLSADCG